MHIIVNYGITRASNVQFRKTSPKAISFWPQERLRSHTNGQLLRKSHRWGYFGCQKNTRTFDKNDVLQRHLFAPSKIATSKSLYTYINMTGLLYFCPVQNGPIFSSVNWSSTILSSCAEWTRTLVQIKRLHRNLIAAYLIRRQEPAAHLFARTKHAWNLPVGTFTWASCFTYVYFILNTWMHLYAH